MNTLYTDRLVLRPFCSGDAEAMYKNWTYDERVARYCRWYPHTSISATEEYLKMCISAEYSWAITLKNRDEPIGGIDLVGTNSVGVPEIGYVLMYEHWGQGIMTEAVTAVIDELFRNGFDKIGACHNIDNPASGRVMEKCGMTYVRSCMAQKKFGSDEQCEVKCYEICRRGTMEYWKELRKKVGHDKIILNCVGAAIFNSDNQVLLQKRKGGELWGFPGGVMELGESFEETIVREVMEETGLQIEVKQLIGVYSKYSDSYPNGDKSQPVLIFLECQAVGGTLDCSDDETLELRYFDLNCPPPIFNKQHEDMLNDLKSFNGKCFIR